MDNLYDMIKEIRESNDMEYSDTPVDLFEKSDAADFTLDINLSIGELVEHIKNQDIKGCINDLLFEMYSLLDRLVQHGIYPSSILELLIKDDTDNIKKDGYGLRDHFCLGYLNVSKDIEYEVFAMSEEMYQKRNDSIDKYYNTILNNFNLCNIECGKEPTCVDIGYIRKYWTVMNEVFRYYTFSVLSDEKAECIIIALYENLKLFALMGVNPKELIEKYIEKRGKKIKKARSK